MFTNIKFALSIAMILGAVPAALAAGSENEDRGGFVIDGSTAGVNPAYHPELLTIGRDGRVTASAMPTNSKILNMMHSRGHLMGKSLIMWRDDKGIHVCTSCGA